MGKVNAEYARKIQVAADLADAAWLRGHEQCGASGGLDVMQSELRWLRYNDADPVVIAEVERLYHRQCLHHEGP